MGQILDCNCENCGYRKKELLLGNGENREYYYFPAFDSKRKTEVQIDISALVEEFDQKDSIINIDGLNELKEKGKIPYFVKGMYKRTKLIGEPISSASLYYNHNIICVQNAASS